MISIESVQTLIGTNAYGLDGSKLGTIGQVYLDNSSGQPEWATVKTGLFGTRENFVPLREAELADDGVRLPYDKDRIKGAPDIDADQEVSPEEETALYEYYGFPVGGTTTGIAGTAEQAVVPEGTATGTTGYDTSGPTTDDAMTRSQEQVRAGTETREAGLARLRKYVVTEQQRVDVPVTHEEVRIEREPITEANRGPAMAGPELSEEEHEVVLREERPVIQKETVPVERVRLDKDQVRDDQTVEVDVREERIEADVDPGVERR